MFVRRVGKLLAPASGVLDFPVLNLQGVVQLEFILAGITVTTDGSDIHMIYYIGGSEITAGYKWDARLVSSNDNTDFDGDASDPHIQLNPETANYDVGNAAGECFGAHGFIDNPGGSTFKNSHGTCSMNGPTGAHIAGLHGGTLENTGAITGIKFGGSSALTGGMAVLIAHY